MMFYEMNERKNRSTFFHYQEICIRDMNEINIHIQKFAWILYEIQFECKDFHSIIKRALRVVSVLCISSMAIIMTSESICFQTNLWCDIEYTLYQQQQIAKVFYFALCDKQSLTFNE